MVKIKGIDLFAPISLIIPKLNNETELHLAMVIAMKIAHSDPEEGTEEFYNMAYLIDLVMEYLEKTESNSMTIPIEVFKLVFGFTEDVYDDVPEEELISVA